MKVLLIGGTGFIGTWLAKALCEAGHSVRIVGRSWPSDERWKFLPKSGREFRQGDFRRTIARSNLLADVDAIVPLAWLLGSVASDGDPMGSLEGAANILALLHTLVKLKVSPLIVFPSSHLVPRSRCLYSIHKALVENHLDYYWEVHGIPFIALRTGKAYGPLQRRGVVWSYIKWALAGEPLPVYGEGKDKIAFIYVQDAARGLKWAIEGKFPPNRTYNLVGHNSTMTQIAEAILGSVRMAVKHLPEIKHVPWPYLDQLLDAGNLPLGNDLHHWGWEPEIGLKTGMDRTVDWAHGILA